MDSPAQPIKISIRGVGHIPSFKNSKQLAANGGKPLMFTKKEYAEVMEKITRGIEFQLLSEYRTRGGVTSMGLSLQSWIAQFWPEDDSRQFLIDERVTLQIVEEGEEGFDLTVEKVEPL